MRELVPKDFEVPKRLETPEFIIRKLMFDDAQLDYEAVMSSIDIILKTRGGNWPSPDLTFKDDQIDLGWHQREFENKTSFAYTVMNPEETKCLGCFYFYPAGYRKEPPEGADVDVSFWVTQKGYNEGLYLKLYHTIQDWLKTWPFQNPHWTNKELPE